MKKSIIAAIIAAASISAVAEPVFPTVDIGSVEIGAHTSAEFDQQEFRIRLQVAEPEAGVMYEICPVFNADRRVGDSFDGSVDKTGNLLVTFFRDDEKTLLTPEKCWPVVDPKQPQNAVMSIKPTKYYLGGFELRGFDFIARQVGIH